MDSNNKKRLNSLGLYFGAKDGFKFKTNANLSSSVLEGVVTENVFGTVFFQEKRYRNYYQHGLVRLNQFEEINNTVYLPDLSDKLNLSDCAFLDTETTGLSYSGGTFAFMVGVGYFENNEFQLRQYFLRNPNDEAATLLDLENLLSKFQVLVSYNGISFDLPILKSRFIYQRIPSDIKEKKNIDLLKYARILFKYQFEDRSLKSIEKNVIKFARSEDEIPGYLAPLIYQEYLETKNVQSILRVFYHNAMDIVSLAALLYIFCEISLKNKDHFNNFETLNFSLGKHYEKKLNYPKAVDLFHKAIEQNNLSQPYLIKCYLSIASIYKKQLRYQDAEIFWEKAADLDNIDALIELAKVNEHKFNNPNLAINYCKKALLILQNDINSIYREYLKKEIDYRMARLQKKVNK